MLINIFLSAIPLPWQLITAHDNWSLFIVAHVIGPTKNVLIRERNGEETRDVITIVAPQEDVVSAMLFTFYLAKSVQDNRIIEDRDRDLLVWVSLQLRPVLCPKEHDSHDEPIPCQPHGFLEILKGLVRQDEMFSKTRGHRDQDKLWPT